MTALDAAALAKFFADFEDRLELQLGAPVFFQIRGERVPICAVRAALDRLVELERGVAAIAHAVGIEHAPDQGPTWPGTIEEIVAEVNRQRDAARSARDNLRGQRDRAEERVKKLETVVERAGKCAACGGHGAVPVNAHGAQEVACHECAGTGLTAEARAVLSAADAKTDPE